MESMDKLHIKILYYELLFCYMIEKRKEIEDVYEFDEQRYGELDNLISYIISSKLAFDKTEDLNGLVHIFESEVL